MNFIIFLIIIIIFKKIKILGITKALHQLFHPKKFPTTKYILHERSNDLKCSLIILHIFN